MRRKKRYRYIYGPVASWRLGRSLGVDLLSSKKGKTCSFDCIYCQAGRTRVLTSRRRVFVPTAKVIEEIKSLPRLKLDYITFSGTGEPTLARNLGQTIRGIRRIRKEKIAVLTNSSIIYRKDVQEDLGLADFVAAKLEAHSQGLFTGINKPLKGIRFDKVIKGLKEFRSRYKGTLAIQIMFMDENKDYAGEIARLALELRPDQIHLCTPLRPCGIRPLSRKELDRLKKFFKKSDCTSVYDAKKKRVKPLSKRETLRRRGRLDSAEGGSASCTGGASAYG